MAKYKSVVKKTKLKKALNQNRRIPLFVVARTKRKVSTNFKARNWRKSKLKIEG